MRTFNKNMGRFILMMMVMVSLSNVRYWSKSVAYAADAVKITILLPLSGGYKNLGASARDGFLLGVEQESAELNADISQWITLSMVDTKSDTKQALPLVQKSVANGSQAVMGIISSGVGLAIGDYVLNKAKVPLIVFGSCGTWNLRTENPLFLRTTYSNHQIGYGLGLWMRNHPVAASQKKKARWACIYTNYQAGVELCDGFKMGYEGVGEEVGRIAVPVNTSKKSEYLIQLSKLRPSVAFAFFVGVELELFLQDYYRFGLNKKIPLGMAGAVLSPKVLQSAEKTLGQYGTAVGITNADSWNVGLDNAENRLFVKRYQQKYGKLPPTFAMNGYDTGRLLVKALVKLDGKWDAEQVVRLMKTLPLISPRHGKTLKFDAHGDAINAMQISVITQQENRLINKLIGETPEINLDEQSLR
ncbi:ABC transporter substrate-binding protein [Desulfobacterales bacterium HSG2]|nr:ABC transporter substrate-binding protein [Desulfobacterales bacterium HSG2]